MLDLTMDRIDDAVARANAWFGIAKPVIEAYLKLDDTQSELVQHAIKHRVNYRDTPLSRTYEEPRRDIEKAMDNIYKTIEGIRADHICDEWQNHEDGDSAADEDRKEAENKAVEARVMSVKAAIDQVAGDFLAKAFR